MPNIPANYQRLKGSERKPAQGTQLVGPADPNQTLTVTIRVRRRPDGPPPPDHAHWMATPPGRRRFITHDEFAQQYGAAKEDLEAVTDFSSRHGMTVAETSIAGRTVVVTATVGQVSSAFGVTLAHYELPGGTYCGHDGFVHVPSELAETVTAVFGLDNRRLGFRNNPDPPGTTGLTPTLIAQLYNFPQGAPDASSQRIGVVEFATAQSGWTPVDVQATLGGWLATATSPSVTDVGTGNSMRSDSETILDICTASAVAPGAKIQVYWGGDGTSAQDWFTVIDRIFHNPKPGDPHYPQVLSISWTLIGGDDFITPAGDASAMLIDEISSDFQDMALAGITVLVASGDGGSLGWNNSAAAPPSAHGEAHVGYPASDPWVTSCGGTTTGVTAAFALGEEWVWNDANEGNPGATGGGISAFFSTLPPWQAGVVTQKSIGTGMVGRGVPDVAGNASLNSGYLLSLNSESVQTAKFSGPYAGTSAVGPLYAGLVAMINARLGYSVGFLNPTLYAFRDTVCVDINDQLFPGSPPDNGFGGSPGYPSVAGWDGCTGLGRIDGGELLAALQGVAQKSCQFILDRTEIGKAEVSETLTGSTPGVIANAFYVVVDGFSASDLGIAVSDLSPNVPMHNPTFSLTGVPASSLSLVAAALLAEDVSLPGTPQRFTWVCDAHFNPDLTAFAQIPAMVTLKAVISTVAGSATLELVANADPYELDGPFSWLSNDLRVFQMKTDGSLPGLPTVTLGNTGKPQVDAPNFIKAVIAGFNGNTTPPPDHPFDNISIDQQVSEVTLNPTDSATGLPIYNFAVARVRYQSDVPSSLLRVFFRLFQAATTSTAYETQTYATVSNSQASMSGKIPVFGINASGELVAIPCFADSRVAVGANLSTQTDDTNVLLEGMQPAADGGVAYAYFGCWLDINQSMTNAVPKSPVPLDSTTPWTHGSQSVLAAIRGQHQCLVMELSYDADPVIPGETPASSDKLAQRNLAIVPSSNPGNPASHRIPQTFDIRPTPPALPDGATFDEVMIQWGNTPTTSTAALYLPGLSAAEVLALAAKMYQTHKLSWGDDHTLLCRTGGVTWIPIPRGAGANFAGLLTVDLPSNVRKGQVYTIVVRQMTNLTLAGRLLDDGKSRTHATGQIAGGSPPITERHVLGSFQLTIPVETEETLLEPEEHLLAIMRWIGSGIPATDRWSPVFHRYITQIADRVEGFGGDPKRLLPSGTGTIPPGAKPHDQAFTGKVTGLTYDRFGDFEGFLLLTEDGHEYPFQSKERPVETLLHRAWLERIVITVFVHRSHPSRPVTIVLRQPPPQLNSLPHTQA